MLKLQFCFLLAARSNKGQPTRIMYAAAQRAQANGHPRAAFMAMAQRQGYNFFTARTQWQRAKGAAPAQAVAA